MRSWLVVPADRQGDFAAALSCGADALALELGNSTDRAARARAWAAARDFLGRARGLTPRPALYVRVASVEGGLIDADLAALVPLAPDGVLLEEACGGASVQHLSAKLAVHEAEAGLEDGATRIVALATQTPAGVFALGAYAGASRRLAGLAFDAAGLGDCLGVKTWRLPNGELASTFALARALVLFGAAAAGVAAIDAAFPDIAEETAWRAECLAARRDGFAAKMTSRPAHVHVINELFADR
ncbi:MAG: aldolase [Methylocystis sp.]|nr:aldolase [Methylocystis sp.]